MRCLFVISTRQSVSPPLAGDPPAPHDRGSVLERVWPMIGIAAHALRWSGTGNGTGNGGCTCSRPHVRTCCSRRSPHAGPVLRHGPRLPERRIVLRQPRGRAHPHTEPLETRGRRRLVLHALRVCDQPRGYHTVPRVPYVGETPRRRVVDLCGKCGKGRGEVPRSRVVDLCHKRCTESAVHRGKVHTTRCALGTSALCVCVALASTMIFPPARVAFTACIRSMVAGGSPWPPSTKKRSQKPEPWTSSALATCAASAARERVRRPVEHTVHRISSAAREGVHGVGCVRGLLGDG